MNEKHRIWALIDYEQLSENFRNLKKMLAPGCGTVAVVKADAYGHGAIEVSRVMEREGADLLAVATPEEGFLLRENGIGLPILVLGYSDPVLAKKLVRENITQAVYSVDYAKLLEKALEGEILSVHIKINTGMTRLGFSPEAVLEIKNICETPCFSAEGIFTHFCDADEEDSTYIEKQTVLFESTVRSLREAGIDFRYRHCANSAASVRFGGCDGMTLSRFGISLYGSWPSAYMKAAYAANAVIRPVMQVCATVAQVQKVAAGTPISYNQTFTAEKDMRVAVITAGYADGIPRLWSNRGCVVIGGVRCPIVGRVCMDMMMVDVSALPESPQIGSEAVLFGWDGVDAAEAASWADTISYELFCRIAQRVPRIAK